MPLPKPRAQESDNQFINRCMVDNTMLSEYANRNQRYAVCNNLLTQKKIETKSNENKIAKQFAKQIKIAQKKNYPLVYQYYMKNYNQAMDYYRIDNSETNQNFNTLFKENEMTEMYKQMYRQTGLRFFLWYRKNFKLFVEKLNEIELQRLIDKVERGQKLTQREMQNLESTVLSGMDQYATQRTNYLALASQVTSVSGVARETLKKVIRELTADERFMSLGLEQRVKEITKRLTFKARWMAKRVVQTETTAAANNGISLSAQDVYGKDNLLKKWIAGGLNIRDTHSTAMSVYSRRPIAENKPYLVGSSYLMFPGDTSMGAMAKEIVNCKCISLPIVKAD
mgnify:CR=1 FL=1|tara:strand:+ start:6717 stop:7733 length:1017 start_codon:yes stop_codon:yes gene_type:complete